LSKNGRTYNRLDIDISFVYQGFIFVVGALM